MIAVVSPWGLGWISAAAAVVAFELVVCAGGAVQSGIQVGYASLLIELAPIGRRQAFVSLVNTFVGPTLILPMLGGLLVDRVNAPTLFALCAMASVFGYRAAKAIPPLAGPRSDAPDPEGREPAERSKDQRSPISALKS